MARSIVVAAHPVSPVGYRFTIVKVFRTNNIQPDNKTFTESRASNSQLKYAARRPIRKANAICAGGLIPNTDDTDSIRKMPRADTLVCLKAGGGNRLILKN